MAVLRGLKVTIEVDGEALQEYDEEDDFGDDDQYDEDQDADYNPDPDSVTKYVEARSDKAFAIIVKIKRCFEYLTDVLVFEFLLDGKPVDGRFIHEKTLRQRRAVKGSPTMERASKRMVYGT